MSIVLKAATKSSGVVVVLHGLGDSGRGWYPVAQMWQRDHPHLTFVLPNAPNQPVTLNGGAKMPSWHDIVDLETIDHEEKENFTGVEESRAIVSGVIDQLVKEGTPAERVALVGFSQGAAMAVITGFQYTAKLAGVVGMSGYLPFKGDFSAAINTANRDTPCLMCHGDRDRVVATAAGQRCYDRLVKAKVPVDFSLYPGMEHSSCPKEIKDVSAFLKKVLPPQ